MGLLDIFLDARLVSLGGLSFVLLRSFLPFGILPIFPDIYQLPNFCIVCIGFSDDLCSFHVVHFR